MLSYEFIFYLSIWAKISLHSSKRGADCFVFLICFVHYFVLVSPLIMNLIIKASHQRPQSMLKL